MRPFALVLIGLASLAGPALAPPTAAADGPTLGGSPALVDQLYSADSRLDYVVTKEPDTTLVVARDATARAVVHALRLPGQWGLPQVTTSLQTPLGGLSPDGRTLVLQSVATTYPEAVSRFAVIDTTWQRRPRILVLHGGFAFDALSPHAATLYLIQDRQRSMFATYSVRALDLASGKLVRRPIVERGESSALMQGYASARATSRSGDWVYTLYLGLHSFVHALHTTARGAECIDLPWGSAVAGGLTMWLGPHGHTLWIDSAAGKTLAVIDLRTHTLRQVAAKLT
jgi:hypothetical protein